MDVRPSYLLKDPVCLVSNPHGGQMDIRLANQHYMALMLTWEDDCSSSFKGRSCPLVYVSIDGEWNGEDMPKIRG